MARQRAAMSTACSSSGAAGSAWARARRAAAIPSSRGRPALTRSIARIASSARSGGVVPASSSAPKRVSTGSSPPTPLRHDISIAVSTATVRRSTSMSPGVPSAVGERRERLVVAAVHRERAGQHQRRADARGREGRGHERLARVGDRRRVPGHELGAREVEQEVGVRPVVLGERAPEQPDGGVGRAAGERRRRRAAQRLRDPDAAGGRRGDEVRRRALRPAAPAPEQLGGGRVGEPEPVRGDPLVDGRAHHGCRKRTGSPGASTSAAASRSAIRAALLQPQVGERGDAVEPGVAVEHRDRLGEPLRADAERRDAREHGARDARGRHHGDERRAGGVGRRAGRAQRGRELAEQERVAARRLVARAGERGVDGRPERPLQRGCRHGARAQRAQAQSAPPPRPEPRRRIAARQDDEQRQAVEPPREVASQRSEASSAHWTSSTIERERRAGGEPRRQPVEAVVGGVGRLGLALRRAARAAPARPARPRRRAASDRRARSARRAGGRPRTPGRARTPQPEALQHPAAVAPAANAPSSAVLPAPDAPSIDDQPAVAGDRGARGAQSRSRSS